MSNIQIELAHPRTGQILTYWLTPEDLERAIQKGYVPVDATTEEIVPAPDGRLKRWAKRREARREARLDWILKQISMRPAVGVYVMTVVSVVYLTWQTAPMLRDPQLRWVGIVFMIPMIIGIAVMGRLTGKLVMLTHAMDERDRAKKQAEKAKQEQFEVLQVKLKEQHEKAKAHDQAQRREEHESEDCPGPEWDPEDETVWVGHVCQICRTRWEWQGVWTAP